jgi:hypothetical protein
MILIIVDCLHFNQQNHRWNENSSVIFGGVSENVRANWNFQFDLTDENID